MVFFSHPKIKKKSEFFWDRTMVEWRNKSKQSRTRYLTWNSGLFSYKIFCCKQNWQSDMTYIRTNSPDGKPIQTPTKKLKHINPIHTSLTLVLNSFGPNFFPFYPFLGQTNIYRDWMRIWMTHSSFSSTARDGCFPKFSNYNGNEYPRRCLESTPDSRTSAIRPVRATYKEEEETSQKSV